MKPILFSFALFLNILPICFASEAATQTLLCGGGSSGQAVIYLDGGAFEAGSGLQEAVNATISYQYSRVRKMVCHGLVDQGSYNLKCIGYYAGNGEPVELTVVSGRGKILARWNLLKGYGGKMIEKECRLKP